LKARDYKGPSSDGDGDGASLVPIAFHPTQDPISRDDGLTHCRGSGSSRGCATAAVAFTKSKRAQSTTDDESWVPGEVSPTFNCFDQGDTRATTVVAYDVLGTPATNAAKETDVHVPLRARTPGQSEASTTTVVAQAFTHSGYSNKPAWITGDRTDCLPSSGHGDTSHQGIGVMQPMAFAQNQLGEVRTNGEVMGTVNTNQNASGRNTPMVQQAMAVRRLTPRECERLQGFPDDYTAIEYRKKPAADGPRYKALGNSMAVPVMAWIGQRIQAATPK
jgi:DNA (cytosine-5)-methyltransferase 1